jgi:predicted phage terminase large subunit-like protein
MWSPHPVEWTSTKYSNDKAGFRMATTVGGAATGEHADIQLVDDPIKPLDAPGDRLQSKSIEEVINWWDETMSTRMRDPKTARRVIIMQRLHENDLAGHVLASGGYTHLCLPMEAERSCVVSVPHRCSMPESVEPTELGFRDPRPEGVLLWPSRFPAEVLEVRHKEMGPRASAAQDQQRPVPAGGGIFKRDWVQHWTKKPARGEMIQSWDMTFKNTADSDYVVGQLWQRDGADFYLLDQWRAKATFSETCKAVISFTAKHPRAIRKLIEDKANGTAIMDMLKNKIPGMVPIEPLGGKIARANAVEPLWAAGNVWIPDPERAPWVHDFIEELVTFNGDPGRHDDQVDAMTQALAYFTERSTDTYRKAIGQWTSMM